MLLRENASTLARMEVEKDAREDAMQMQRAEMMKKSDIIRSIRHSHLERREAEYKERFVRAKQARDLRNQRIERTYKLAKELSRIKNLESQELLELRLSKRAAQFSTARCHEDERARLLEEKVRREAMATEALRKWHGDESFIEIQLAKAEEKKLCYRADLQNQIIEKRRILRENDEEKQRERKILEEMAEVIHEEDLREETRKREISNCLQAEKDAFFEARRTWKEILKATLCEENKKIGEVAAEKEALYKEQIEGKSDIRKARDATIEKIARKMLDEEIKMKEREDICNELYLEKKNNEIMNEYRRRLLEKQRRTEELQDDMVRRKIADAEKEQDQRALDEELTRHLYKEWRRLDELDKQKIEKQREKNKQYGEELKNIITKNKIEYAVGLLRRQKENRSECEERN